MSDRRTGWDPTTGFEDKPTFDGDSGQFLAELPLLPQELGPHFFGQLSLRLQLDPGAEVTLDLKAFAPVTDHADALAQSVGAWRRADAPDAQRASERFGALLKTPPPTPREGEHLTIPVHARYLGVAHEDDVPWHVITLSFGWGTGGELVVHVNQKVGRTRWFMASDTPLLLMWQLTHALHHVRPHDADDVASSAPLLDVASEVFEIDGEFEVCVREHGAWWVLDGDRGVSLRFAPPGEDSREVHVFEGVLYASNFAADANVAVLLMVEDEQTLVWHRVRWTDGPESLDVQRWDRGPAVHPEGITVALSPDGDSVATLEEDEHERACLSVFDAQGARTHRGDDLWSASLLWGWDGGGVRFTTSGEPELSQRWSPGQPYEPTTAYRLVSPDGAHRVDYERYGLTHAQGHWRLDYVLEQELLALSPLVPDAPESAMWIDASRFYMERDDAPAHAVNVATGQRQLVWAQEPPFVGWLEFAMHQRWGVCYGDREWVWVRRVE